MNSAPGTIGTLTLGNSNTTETLQFGTIVGGPVSAGSVALAKIGNGTLTLNNTFSHDGNTTISAGTLALGPSGAIPNSAEIIIASNATFNVSQTFFDLGSSQTLTGSGSVNGSMQADGTLSPVGTLTINGDLTVNGNLTFTVNTSMAQSNDIVAVSGALNNIGAGTVTLSNVGPALVAGQTFALFNQPLNNGDTLTIVPPPGVVLTNHLALDGTLTVVSAPVTSQPYITNVRTSGTNLIINGTNGSAGQQFEVLSSTNVSSPLANWTSLSTSIFTGGNFSVTNAINSGESRRFYIIRVP
jgi:autotransporter-associated beta strand protein